MKEAKNMRMNKKAVSPVIAVMLLVAVAVAAVGAYFIWYKSFQQSSQSDVEEKTGTIGSKLSITNVTNDNANFYVTVKNATGEDLTAAMFSVSVKDEDGVTVGALDGVNPNITGGGANIPDGDEGQIEMTAGTGNITAGETYTIIVTASGTTSTQKYTAI